VRFQIEALGPHIPFVQDDVINVVALSEVIDWATQHGVELLEPCEIATVSTPDHCLVPCIRNEISVHARQHQHALAGQCAQIRSSFSKVGWGLRGVFSLAKSHDSVEVCKGCEAGDHRDDKCQADC